MSIVNITNEFIVNDIVKSINFYKDILDFEVTLIDGDPIYWAKLENNGQIIMIQSYTQIKKEIPNFPSKSIPNNIIKIDCSSLEVLNNIYKKVEEKKLKILSDYTKTEYGSVEFAIYDPDDNILLINYYL